MAENYITIENVSKSFGEKELFSSIGFGINKGQKIALVAENGSGKTTLLKIIANKENADNGLVSFRKGITISYLEQHPLQNETSTIIDVLFNSSTPLMKTVKRYQQALLDSTKSSDENTEKELSEAISEMDCQNAWNYESQIKEILGKLNITDLTKNVSTLSGGEKKKVALCATLISKSEVLLLDEPLAALDLKLRKEMQYELKRIQQEVGITFIFVTHDQEEALTMSDTIVVMKDGTIQQIGDPKSIYDEPANAFVADFIGESNILRGTMIKDELVEVAGATFPCVDSGFGENAPVDVVIRPEDIMLVGEDVGQIVGTVKSVLFKGVHYEMMIDTGAYTFKVHSTSMQPQGSKVGVNIVPFNIHIMKPMQEDK